MGMIWKKICVSVVKISFWAVFCKSDSENCNKQGTWATKYKYHKMDMKMEGSLNPENEESTCS